MGFTDPPRAPVKAQVATPAPVVTGGTAAAPPSVKPGVPNVEDDLVEESQSPAPGPAPADRKSPAGQSESRMWDEPLPPRRRPLPRPAVIAGIAGTALVTL